MIKYVTLPLLSWFISVMWAAITDMTLKHDSVFWEFLIVFGVLGVAYILSDLYKYWVNSLDRSFIWDKQKTVKYTEGDNT